MPFHVIALDTKEPVRRLFDNEPIIYTTGDEAAGAADMYSATLGKKHKPQRIKGDPNAWKKREADRFLEGQYTKLPWHKERWFAGSIGETEHFAHVSKEKPGMIAFTENDEKGEADIRTRIKAGTYLERFFSDKLTGSAIQTYARDFAGRYEENGIKYAVTEDEIARVYVNGPRSCMSGPETGLYQSPKHPCRAYASGDLAVAYLELLGSIVARSVVWPEKKVYYNIYGDHHRLEPLLSKEGYKQGNLTGAKLKRIEFTKGGSKFLAVPHIDGVGRITVHPDHLVIGGNVAASNTSGAVHLPEGTQCTCCGTWGHTRSSMATYPDVQDSLYCTSCQRSNTYVCKATGVRYGNRESVWTMGGINSGRPYFWSREYFRQHGAVCTASGRYLPRTEVVPIGSSTTQFVATALAKESRHAFTCSECSKAYLRQGYSGEGKGICRQCYQITRKKKEEA